MTEECEAKKLSTPALVAIGNTGRDDSEMSATPRPSIRRIVIPLDETACAERGRDVGIKLAQTFGAEILLIRCYSERTYLPSGNAALGMTSASVGQRPTTRITPTPIQHPLHAALAYLEQTEAEITRAGLIVRTEAVQWPPSFAIVHLANRPLTDLVVMVTHLGASDSSKPISGSITREVIEHIAPRVPVLLLPVTWMAEMTRVHDHDAQGLRTMVAALAHLTGNPSDDSGSSELVRSYAGLFAQSFGGTLTEVSIPPDVACLSMEEISIESTDQNAVPQQIGMFVIGGAPRAALLPDAQRLLYAAHAPVLVVSEA